MIRILHILYELDGGGVERLLWNYYSHLDYRTVQFDFAVSSKEKGILEDSFLGLGCRIYHIPRIHDGIGKYKSSIKQILAESRYDIIHVHTGFKGFIPLRLAKQADVQVRIVHAHQAFIPENRLNRIMRALFTWLAKKYSTQLFACGESAATWMWGSKICMRDKVYIMRNAIEVSRFSYSQSKRDELRQSLGLQERYVVGNVARFTQQKNHEFLLAVFKELLKIQRDAVLLLIGRGELEDVIKERVHQLELDASVKFLGVRNDVQDLLNTFDVFVLPSQTEGFGIVFIEAQANGLPCFGTQGAIPDEVCVTNSMYFLPLGLSAGDWARAICKGKAGRNLDANKEVARAGYDINDAAIELSNYYKELCNEK